MADTVNEFARLSDLPSMRDIRETWSPAFRQRVDMALAMLTEGKDPKVFRNKGYVVVRFPASEVFHNIDSVLSEIAERILSPNGVARSVLSESACRQNTATNTALPQDTSECKPGNSEIRERRAGRESGERLESSVLQG